MNLPMICVIEEEAERFLERYCPEALKKPMSVPISDIAHDMGLKIIQGNRITNDFRIFGEIYFTNSKATVYDLFKISKTTIDVHMGDILVDAYTFWERNLGCVKKHNRATKYITGINTGCMPQSNHMCPKKIKKRHNKRGVGIKIKIKKKEG